MDRGPTIRKFRIVRREGQRDVARLVEHYSLDAILAVGYRVRSERGTQFRRWATERLREYLVKGFAMDDERLKNPPVDGSGVPDYFDELLERIGQPIDLKSKVRICTKLSSTAYCQIPGKREFKWPKLSELSAKLFGRELLHAHDAAADVAACAECFFELKRLGVIRIEGRGSV